jgi:hypothetical protein
MEQSDTKTVFERRKKFVEGENEKLKETNISPQEKQMPLKVQFCKI